MRIRLEGDLNTLRSELIDLGNIAEGLLEQVAEVLEGKEYAPERAESELLRLGETKQRLESGCLRVLAYEQPMASDFRLVSGCFKAASHLKRIGEQAAAGLDISAEALGYDGDGRQILRDMLWQDRHMLQQVLMAFARHHAEEAAAVIEMDDEVDALFAKLRDGVVQELRQSTEYAAELTDLLLMGKYLEKMGDHAASAAGWVLFALGKERESTWR